jgi:hypothetical protein
VAEVARVIKAGATWVTGEAWAACGAIEAADVVTLEAAGAGAGVSGCIVISPVGDASGAAFGDAGAAGPFSGADPSSAWAAVPTGDGAPLCRIDATCEGSDEGSALGPAVG